MMNYVIALLSGIASFVIYRCCSYDLLEEKTQGRISYLLTFERKRILELAICVGLACGITFLLFFYGYGPLKIIRYCLLLAFLFPIAREDARAKRIPNGWLVTLLAFRGVLLAAEAVCYPAAFGEVLVFSLSGGIICGGIMYMAYVISRHAIGMGDVKLFAVTGLFLGTKATYAVMFTASVLAALYGIGRVITRKMNIKDEVAFGPFIAMATFIVVGMGF